MMLFKNPHYTSHHSNLPTIFTKEVKRQGISSIYASFDRGIFNIPISPGGFPIYMLYKNVK